MGDTNDASLEFAGVAASVARQLISLKDSAHYGFLSVSSAQLKQTMRQANYLIEFAEQVLLRS